MMISNKDLFVEDLYEMFTTITASAFAKKVTYESFLDLKNYLIEKINELSDAYQLNMIRDENVIYNGKKGLLDIVFYQGSTSILAIDLSCKFIGKSIAKLLSSDTEKRILISIFPDKSLPENMLKRFDSKSSIQLIHIPNINIRNNIKDTEVNSFRNMYSELVDSPLELKLERKLKENNLNFVSQYAVYERRYTGVMKYTPKYIIDFVVKGEDCKIAIECDGLYYHLRDSQRVHDTYKDIWLMKYGFDNVLRFYSDEIHNNLNGCVDKIKKEVEGWDKYYRQKKKKSVVNVNKINDIPSAEEVRHIVTDLANPISNVVKTMKKNESKGNLKSLIHNINKIIYKIGYSNEITLLYYSLPELSSFINQTHGAYFGYNIPFVLYVIKPDFVNDIPDYIKMEKQILKVIVMLEKNIKVDGINQYVFLDGYSGKIMKSDILIMEEKNEIKGEGKELAKQKFYVVWSGKHTGIFNTWEECKKQVIGVKGAKYKSFSNKEEAMEAYQKGYVLNKKIINNKVTNQLEQLTLLENPDYLEESISVDAACSGNPGNMEYKGVYTKNGKVIFHFGPIPNGTNNVGEFIAIVHALALMKQKNSSLPVYSDSLIAISWIKKKKVNTNIPRDKNTERIWNLIDRAELWLQKNIYSNEILKWETKYWGEIKADFGRK